MTYLRVSESGPLVTVQAIDAFTEHVVEFLEKRDPIPSPVPNYTAFDRYILDIPGQYETE